MRYLLFTSARAFLPPSQLIDQHFDWLDASYKIDFSICVLKGNRKVPVLHDGLAHLRIELSESAYIGPGRADLLELIDQTGSISSAGKAMGMSYKRAWGLVRALNVSFGEPLVESTRGGAAQGGAVLTDAGRFVLGHYRHIQQKTRTAIKADVDAMRQRFDMSVKI